jgi:transposase
LTDAQGRPRLLMLSAGNINDMTMAAGLIEAAAGRFDRLIADRGNDTNAIRAAIAAQGALVVITCHQPAPLPSPTIVNPTRLVTSSNDFGAASKDWRRIGSAADAGRTSQTAPSPGSWDRPSRGQGQDMERRRRLADLLAVPAAELLPDVLDHLPGLRDHLQRLGDVLAELRQPF